MRVLTMLQGQWSKAFPKIAFLLLLAGFARTSAQSRDFALTKAGSIVFQKSIFVFGVQAGTPCKIAIYKADSLLNLKDSLFFITTKKSPDDFLKMTADTLHGALQLYCPTKDTQEGVTIMRPSADFTGLQTIKAVDKSRVNNQQLFSQKKWQYGNSIYDVIRTGDSSSLQFYINAYELADKTGNYDYRRTWQFPVERKGIYDLHVVHADQRFVYLYAYRKNETGSSQWLLKLDAKNGSLVKATRVAAEKNVYRLCSAVPSKKGEVVLSGQVMQASPGLSLWLCNIDSTGQKSETILQRINSLPPSDPKKKQQVLYSNFTKLRYKVDGRLLFTCQLFERSNPGSLKIVSCGTVELSLSELETPRNQSIQTSPDLSFYYSSPDVNDRNAKVFLPEPGTLETFYQLPLSEQEFPRWQEQGGKEAWLLIKTDLRKSQRQFDHLLFETKKGVLKNLNTIPLANQPSLLETGFKKIAIGQQNTPLIYRVNLYNW